MCAWVCQILLDEPLFTSKWFHLPSNSQIKLQSFLGPITNNKSYDLEEIVWNHLAHLPVLKQNLD